MVDPASASIVAVSGAVEAIARARTLAPEAQVMNAQRRYKRATEPRPRARLRRTKRELKRLMAADEKDDHGEMAAALIELELLGVSAERIREAILDAQAIDQLTDDLEKLAGKGT